MGLSVNNIDIQGQESSRTFEENTRTEQRSPTPPMTANPLLAGNI